MQKNFVKKYLLPVLMIFIFPSCEKENMGDCFKSTGPLVKEERHIGSFNQIVVESLINVVIIQDTIEKVVVEGGRNLIPLVHTGVEDKKLVIRNNNKCNWVRSFKKKINVYVSVKKIMVISSDATGNITSSNTLTGDSLALYTWNSGDINISVQVNKLYCGIQVGVGDITVRGSSDANYVYAAGNGWIRCENLMTGYTYIRNQGTGNCSLSVSQQLDAEQWGIGDIYYSGNPPTVNKNTRGSGKVIAK